MHRRIITVALSCTLAGVGLAGCQSTFSQVMGEAKVELNKLDGTAEGDFDLPYTNVAYDVNLESGSADIEILDVLVTKDVDGDDDVIPLDTIHKADGVSSGDHGTFYDDDGAILVRITSSDGATGTITFSER